MPDEPQSGFWIAGPRRPLTPEEQAMHDEYVQLIREDLGLSSGPPEPLPPVRYTDVAAPFLDVYRTGFQLMGPTEFTNDPLCTWDNDAPPKKEEP